MSRRIGVWLVLLAMVLPAVAFAEAEHGGRGQRHVLLISVDGLHASDLAGYVSRHPGSALARLSARGTTYPGALVPVPTDSFPGLLALVTGGTARSTGVYYDDSYDRSLFAPSNTTCQGAPGTEVVYDEGIDFDPTRLDGGGGIDPTQLPRAKTAAGCVPLFPHSFLRVNTIFNVAHEAGLRTAWSDKHFAYELVNGPSGNGVDDLFTPEIGPSGTITGSVATTEQYDAIKVKAVLNELHGLDSSGAHQVGVPAILGMNFQAVSVAQKLPFNGSAHVGGYFAGGAPTPQLEGALGFVDAQLGKFAAALPAHTEYIITAKHGQSPIDPSSHLRIDDNVIPNIITGATGVPSDGTLAQTTEDDVALHWFSSANQSRTAAAVSALAADQRGANTAHIDRILAGGDLRRLFGDPLADPRVPDIFVQPQHGVVYSLSKKKVAEHGGGSLDDRNVALLVVDPDENDGPRSIAKPVATTSVAPTILKFLDLEPDALAAVRLEDTRALPAG